MNSKLLGALALATAFGLGGGTAEAGHVHFGGHFSGHVRGGGGSFRGGVSVGAHWSRSPYRGYRGYARWGGARGHIYVGPSYGYYYRPYYAYGYSEYVPSYYGASYYPVAPQQTFSTQAVMPVPELPKFGVGLFTGAASTSTDRGSSSTESGDIGIIGRFRLTPGLLLEGELGKTTYQNDVREDRRLGASLVYEIGAYNKWAPYVVGGIGVNQAQVGGTGSTDYSTTQDFAEIGVGIRWAITPSLHLTADIRAGSRNTVSNDNTDTLNGGTATARQVAPPPTSSDSTAESYTRARLAAILYF